MSRRYSAFLVAEVYVAILYLPYRLSENNIGPEGAHALGEGFELLSTSILTTLR